jgi:transcriptional regulator with PAS, ATPase and Fis domain
MIEYLCLTEHLHAYAIIHPRVLPEKQTQYIEAHNDSVKDALQQFKEDSTQAVSYTDADKNAQWYKTEFEKRVASTFEDIRKVGYCTACILIGAHSYYVS